MRLIATPVYICIELAMNVLISIITINIIIRQLCKYYKQYSLQICNLKTIHRLLRHFEAHIIQVTILCTNLVVSYAGIGTLSYNMTCIFLYKKEWFYYM